MEPKGIVSIIFALTAAIGLIGGLLVRSQLRKGTGTQFIRYNAVVLALPISASLATQGMLTEAAVSIISGALAYAFADHLRR